MTGNRMVDNIILGLNAIIISAATALVIYSHLFIEKPNTKRNLEFGNMIESSMVELQKAPIVLEETVVNLYSREVKLRFLETQMNLVLFEERDREALMNMKPKVFDALIDVAGNMQPKELNSVTGRILLETRVKNKVNKIAGRPILKKILFSKFIIQ